MSYTKQEFVSGQILKAEHLNNMENGIEANDAAVTALSEEKANAADVKKIEELFEWGGTTVHPGSSNLLDPAAIDDGKYLTASGIMGNKDVYMVTGYIEVAAGDLITLQYDYTDGRWTRQMNRLTAYNSAKEVIPEAGFDTVSKLYTVPEGVAFIRITILKNDGFSNYAVCKTQEVMPYEEYYPARVITTKTRLKPNAYAEKSAGYRQDTGSESWTGVWENHDMSNFCWSFRGFIPNGLSGDITVGKGNGLSYGAHITVDATKVYYYIGTSETPYQEWEHGLTLKDYISIEYEIGFALFVTLKLHTNGGSWEQTQQNGDMRRGTFYVVNASGEVTDGKFSYYNKSWEAATHVYGDSYLTFANTRWLHYMRDIDGANLFLNGYPGRGSAKALEEVKQTMRYAKRPERIVWLMGMNDGDTDGAINATWQSCTEELMDICEEQGIELILSTIPNVPSVDNTYKNAYVRESGYRYADCAAAVGAAEGTTWFDNMLSSDGVHPDAQGGLALYTQIVADIPEILL